MAGPERIGGARRRGPVPAAVGRAVEPLYRAVINRRNRRWDAGVGVSRLPVPVISVGNLSVGGTGKTPMVVHLVRALRAAGRRPCVAMRGYVRQSHITSTVAPGETLRSDEAQMYEQLLAGVPVVAQPDRLEGVQSLLARGEDIDCVVLDDGFQHRRLARDLDVVLVDASRSPFEDRLLPAGWLREPVGSLKRAGAVVVTHAEMVEAREVDRLIGLVRGVTSHVVVAVARHEWGGLLIGESDEPVEWLRGRKVVAVCAIGNPAGFLRGVWLSGAQQADEIVLPDHDPYRPATIRRVIEAAKRFGATAIVTTEKDWAKLREVPGGEWPCAVVRPRLEMRFVSGLGELERMVVGAASGGR